MLTFAVAKKRIKKCECKGCEKTENDCQIINHSCPEHHAAMKIRGNIYGKNSFMKTNAVKRKHFDFNVSDFMKSSDFLSYYSFLNDVIKTAAVGKGKILALNDVSGSPYQALKNTE